MAVAAASANLPSHALIPSHRDRSLMWRLANISVALLTWILVVNISLQSFSSRHLSSSATTTTTTTTTTTRTSSSSSSTVAGWQPLLIKPSEKFVVAVIQQQKNKLFAGGSIHLHPKANEWGNDEQQLQKQQYADYISRILIHLPFSSTAHPFSARLPESSNNTRNAPSQFSNETHINNYNNQTQSTTTTVNDQNKDDTIFDDLTRGFTFSALFCLGLYFFHKCCSYVSILCGCCPDDERVLQARMRKLRLMKKRAYNPENMRNVGPPLDTRKWAQWMIAHRGTVDTAEDSSFYYSTIVAGGGDGVWDANSDDGSTAWDDETGFVDFDDTTTTSLNNGREEGGVELACRSGNKNAIPELEYGEGEELEDESHDSRLFDAEDGGKGVNSEADKFFTGGRRGRENSGIGTICQAGKIKDDAFVADRKKSRDRGIGTHPTDFDHHQNNTLQQPQLYGKNDAASVFISIPETNGADTFPSMQMMATMPRDTIPTADDMSTNADEGTEIIDMGTDIIDPYDRGYDEETDLLGLRSDSPPPMDLEEMSRIEKKLMEEMENAKPY